MQRNQGPQELPAPGRLLLGCRFPAGRVEEMQFSCQAVGERRPSLGVMGRCDNIGGKEEAGNWGRAFERRRARDEKAKEQKKPHGTHLPFSRIAL